MKYICLGYIEPGKFEGMTEDERNTVFDECFEYNDRLRANGLSRPRLVESFQRMGRPAAPDQSGDRSPHSKELTT
jgi:hypothetical protein